MLKKILIGCGAVLVVGVVAIVALGWWAYRVFTGPVYEPGILAASARLEPPAQDDDAEGWTVESGVRLHHFSLGEGRPILFVHGGPGFPVREPMPWLGTLADSGAYEIIFYDQRGCGASTRPIDRFETPSMRHMMDLESALGLGVQIADIERIRRILDAEQLILVGHSFGGFLAALYAAEFPEHVERLVLLAPADLVVMPAEGGGLFGIVRDRLPAAGRAEYDRFLEEYLDFQTLFEHDEAELAARQLYLASYILRAMGRDPAPLPAPGRGPSPGGWMVYAMYVSMGQRHDYSSALARITADTLVIHGDRDIQPVSRHYAELIPEARSLAVPEADHFFDSEHEALAEAVGAFLRGG